MFSVKNFQHKKACVLGFGCSGRAAAVLLAEKGFDVLVSEEFARPKGDFFKEYPSVSVETGGHTDKIFECDFWVKSPGIFPNSPVLEQGRKLGIPIFSELEVALAFLPKDVRIFAITGTNGKTTTTSLLGHILEKDAQIHKRKVFVCGNIGNPVSVCIPSVKSGDDMVIEVSSYQLEDSTYFRPHVACLLNVTPDHLDHHGGMKNYIKAKSKIFKKQRKGDFLVVNGADITCVQVTPKAKGTVLAFSTQPKHLLKTDVFFDGDELIFSEGHQIRPPQLKGIHNVENAMAAALMALAAGVSADTVQEAFNEFTPMEHRIEPFAYHNGVTYINDSKATNLDSTITALKSFEKEPTVWLILGGRDKGSSYAALAPYLKMYCKKILTIGESMDKIEKELGSDFTPERCGTLEKAVEVAMKNAQKGDVVLLSPACSSFDQFKNFEQRGKIFKQLVTARIYQERTK